jgi:hypothetical protein
MTAESLRAHPRSKATIVASFTAHLIAVIHVSGLWISASLANARNKLSAELAEKA